jgi:cytochrome oxidase Cu insertion factor (SCO1/SenC/PrrC family)
MVNVAEERSKQNLDFFQEDLAGFKEIKEKESLIGGDWTLVDTEGRPFSSQMLNGYYYLVYFGYTHCPGVSPSTLFYLSSVYRIIRNLP